MTLCSCWREYPNQSHKHRNGKWKCVDQYKCIRPCEYVETKFGELMKRKTVCEKIEKGAK